MALSDDQSVNSIFSNIKDNITSAWKWTNNSWAVYLPGYTQEQVTAYIETKGFSPIIKISYGEGFWINSDIPQELTVFGSQPTDTFIYLTSGWNLIGLKSNETRPIVNLITGKEVNITSIWKWQNNTWAVYLPGGDTDIYAQSKGFSVIENINPGEGFWVNCNEAITLE